MGGIFDRDGGGLVNPVAKFAPENSKKEKKWWEGVEWQHEKRT